MNDGDYLKCTCKQCGGHIEFPEEGAGQVASCPHCGQEVILSNDDVEEQGAAEKKSHLWLMIGMAAFLIFAVAAGAYLFLRQHRKQNASITDASANAVSTNSTTTGVTNVGTKTNIKKAKSPADLKFGEVQLERTKGSSLVYAVGTVTNDSEFQRFGVKIELDLLGSNGAKMGTARDYFSILEPHRVWQYRALLTDSKAAFARVATLKEDE